MTEATKTKPRYHLEMALLRWIHLRKLTPIEDVIASLSTALMASTNCSARSLGIPDLVAMFDARRFGDR